MEVTVQMVIICFAVASVAVGITTWAIWTFESKEAARESEKRHTSMTKEIDHRLNKRIESVEDDLHRMRSSIEIVARDVQYIRGRLESWSSHNSPIDR